MEKSRNKQLFSVSFLMTLGGIYILGGNEAAGSESYLAMLLAAVGLVPLLFLYAYIIDHAEGEGVFSFCLLRFGAVGGRILVLLFGLYASFIAITLFGNMMHYIKLVFLKTADSIWIGCVLVLGVTFAVYCGYTAVSRLAQVLAPAMIAALLGVLLIAIPSADIENFPLPVLGAGVRPVATGAWSLLTMPFGELLIIMPLLPSVKNGRSGGKGLIWGGLLSWLLLIFVFLQNILVLGDTVFSTLYYRSLISMRIIGIGPFFQRIETIASVTYIICDMLKLVICTLCIVKCLSTVFGIQEKNERMLATPVTFLLFGISEWLIINELYVLHLIRINKYTAAPFILGVPLIIAAGIRFNGGRKRPRTLQTARNAKPAHPDESSSARL